MPQTIRMTRQNSNEQHTDEADETEPKEFPYWEKGVVETRRKPVLTLVGNPRTSIRMDSNTRRKKFSSRGLCPHAPGLASDEGPGAACFLAAHPSLGGKLVADSGRILRAMPA